MTEERGIPLSREEYLNAQRAAAAEQMQAALAAATVDPAPNGQAELPGMGPEGPHEGHEGHEGTGNPQTVGEAVQGAYGRLRGIPGGGQGTVPNVPGQVPVGYQDPGRITTGPGLPMPPMSDFSKGMSYGTFAGIMLGGLVVVYLLNRRRDEGTGSGSGSEG